LLVRVLSPPVETPCLAGTEHLKVSELVATVKYNELIRHLQSQVRAFIPTEIVIGMLETPAAAWEEKFYAMLTAGAEQGVRSPFARSDTGEPPGPWQCFPVLLTDGHPMCLARGVLLDPESGQPDGVETPMILVCPPPSLAAGNEIIAAARVVIHPYTGRRVLWVEDIDVVATHGGGAAGLDWQGRHAPFRVAPTLAALEQRAGELGRGLAGAVQLAGEQSERLALLTALVHVSPQTLRLPTGRTLAYGALQGLVVGESGSRKTAVAVGVSQLLGLADIAASDTTSRAGLLYQIRGGEVIPGLLPRNHGRMVVLDEVHKIRPGEISAATFARGQGVLRVHAAAQAEFPMQTRLLAVGNLRQRGAQGRDGGQSSCLADLEAGILGTGFLEPEDLRRFDFVMVTSRQATPG
jgi:hypothetical protein